jgi:prevent-host-death family protein
MTMKTTVEPTDLYAFVMAKREILGVQETRDNLRTRVDVTIEDGTHTVVTRHGKPVAVLVPMEWYRRASAALDEPTDL